MSGRRRRPSGSRPRLRKAVVRLAHGDVRRIDVVRLGTDVHLVVYDDDSSAPLVTAVLGDRECRALVRALAHR